MNKISKVLAFCAILSVFGGCTKNFEKYNTDPYAIQSSDPSILIPTMMDALMYVQQNDSQMIDQMVGSLGGYFTLSNRWGGQNFDTFNASDGWNNVPYETMFLDIYANYFEIEKFTGGSGHYYAMARLLRAAAMMRVADMYGPIPYSHVTDGQMYVAYDKNEDVYKSIIEDLKNASSVLAGYAAAYPDKKPLAAQDAIYAGDYAKWAKLANSYIMRAAIRSNDAEAFKSAYESPYGFIADNADNALMSPGAQPNPYQLASASWGDLRSGSSIVDYMNGYKDPRRSSYFTISSKGGYLGMRSGKGAFEKTAVSGYSMCAFSATDKLPVFVAAESQFLLAEAALKGWISGDPGQFYNKGIDLSMDQWKVGNSTMADGSSSRTAYIEDDSSVPASYENDPIARFPNYIRNTKVTIAWSDGATTEQKLEKIITQKWIANYPMGIEAWAEYRRTGYPELAPVIDNLSEGVITNPARGLRRLRYSYKEHTLNKDNYADAVKMLGGKDDESVDLFWAKK
ncbi:MAG: SusD/RagB family nutrient-binding outer membrane lipoprotein [Bacteroidales bacterium]|nr:SusD/RagB family nutrient-binding outer membrane lipoprotein [Bacteroidales bacterium]MDY6001434.1 SusD/RagB family nutrient-binding outer membrane lipoprotein [Candidatus Cryptobacteroides sp.]